MKLREKNLANPRNTCKGISQKPLQSFAMPSWEWLVSAEPSAGNQTSMVPENELIELLDHGVA